MGVRSSLVSSQMATIFPLRVLGVLFTPQDGERVLDTGCGPLTTCRPSAASRSLVDEVWSVELLFLHCKAGGDLCDSQLALFGLRVGEVEGGDAAVFSAKGMDER